MKSLIAAIALFFLLGFAANLLAQVGPPPPPPLIWKAPLASETKRYVNSTHNFSVDLIGDPDVREDSLMSYYTVKRPGSVTYVRVIAFTKEDLQKVSVPAIIANVKSAYGTTREYELVGNLNEKSDFIEFSATNTHYLRRVNARVVNGKLYELYIDIVNWHILKDHYPDKVRAFNEEADRFFRSFSITK